MELTNRIVGAAFVIGLGLPAHAAYVVDLTEEVIGGVHEVVANGSGTIDLTDLTNFTGTGESPGITPSGNFIATGQHNGSFAFYESITGPVGFGSGGFTGADSGSGSGELVGLNVDVSGPTPVPALGVGLDYTSGSAISDSATYSNATFASLGATPGTYVWTWGSGAHADSFTLNIGAASVVPEPSTWAMMLLGFAGLGYAGHRARRSAIAAAL
jgi:hypothetical protein